MRDNMYENRWSPFDPAWYQDAFDKFISTADQLFNQDLIAQQGYCIPDSDGSKSSVFRNEAVLNNSFDEKGLRETLKDLYFNSSHKLVASNHDNVNFFQWAGNIADMKFIPNTSLCEFTMPWNSFINPKERDIFKTSQFYRKWIKVEDILNNWNIFKWHTLLFIDQKIYSEYEIRIDDQEVTIRFKYNDYWVKKNYPVYIYKFSTNAQCRVKITKELCKNQWKWKMPASYISDKRVTNSNNIMVAFNKISDSSIRKDGLTNIEVLGDNLEFLKIVDGYVDMNDISDFNKQYIQSEASEWLWMSIIVPKFFHEYPILLPTDVIFRPYEADFQQVVTLEEDQVQHIKSLGRDNNTQKQVYIDLNGKIANNHDGWKQIIRPIVLSDAFEDPYSEPYDSLVKDLRSIRDLTVKGADIVEDFRFFLQEDSENKTKFNEYLDKISTAMSDIRNAHNTFLDNRMIEYNQTYENLFKNKFLPTIEILKEEGSESEWFDDNSNPEKDFWLLVSPLIFIPRELADKFYIIEIIQGMGHNRVLWRDIDEFMGKVRFQRPIEEQDFWTFEYNQDNKVWRPYPLNVKRHFPDVYLPSDVSEPTPSLNRVFKTFFFYSDTMNVRDESSDITRATPSWDNDMNEYHFDQSAIYRDIFMEKFYWMGIRAIYKGILMSDCRWEVIEYIIDNDSYQRFNELFLQTMDPYFKLGLATYLKSSNFEFPFDDSVSKMTESLGIDWLGYKKITNFEVYLNKTWIPSYFDHVVKIMDNWNYGDRLVKRPRNTFDMRRLLPIMLDVQEEILEVIQSVFDDIEWILAKLKIEHYNLTVPNIVALKTSINEMLDNIDSILKFTKNLDLQIYSIDDINHIITSLKKHIELTGTIDKILIIIEKDVSANNIYNGKRETLKKINTVVGRLPEHISKISAMVQSFDMDGFMKAINDLNSYFDYAKTNPNDNSLIGQVNKFDDPWSKKVKDCRNILFTSTSTLYATYEPKKTYTDAEVFAFVDLVNSSKKHIIEFRAVVLEFWEAKHLEFDQGILDKLDHTEALLSKFNIGITEYYDARNKLVEEIARIKNFVKSFDKTKLSPREEDFGNSILDGLAIILQALSYIAGENRREEALVGLTKLSHALNSWFEFILVEESVFERLIKLVKPPVEFMKVMRDNQIILESMMDYMDTTDLPFVPDASWPTYSDIYEIESIELKNKGFRHKVGETVFVPQLGSYKITSVTEEASQAESVESSGYRKTTFRDPVLQITPYDTITSGSGVGITIKAISSKHTRIINDEVISSIVMRIQNSSYQISRCIKTPNPYNNLEYNRALDDVNQIHEDWKRILDVFENYVTIDMKTRTNKIIDILMTILVPSNTFIETRKNLDLDTFIHDFESMIFQAYEYTEKLGTQDENFFYYDNVIRTSYNDIIAFIDTGTYWSDSEALKLILSDTKYNIKLYRYKVLEILTTDDDLTAIFNSIDLLYSLIDKVVLGLNTIPMQAIPIKFIIDDIDMEIRNIPSDVHKDKWYRINKASPAIWGDGYQSGDIVEIIPELPVDIHGNPIYEMEDIIINDVILFQVVEVDDGRVTKIQPLMNYAVPYLIWGVRKTITRTGVGKDLTVDVFSSEISLSDSTLLAEKDSYIPAIPQFGENDLLMFKFENIHDLNVSYELFLGGKQIDRFFHRHETPKDPKHPKNVDVIYVNANEVMSLKDSSISIPEEHYFIYKIDELKIKDPGAGYALGQEVFVGTDKMALRLKIEKLRNEPYKGIEELKMGDGKILYNAGNPQATNAMICTDSLNNIDDEYNIGYYDKIPAEGIIKAGTLSYDPEEFTFISKRFDNLDGDDRNQNFMYPDIDMPLVEDLPTNGDPDGHWYQGSRIDNSQHPMEDSRRWNGIENLNPPTDPFIPDNKRLPPGKPPKGEYQMFDWQRFHSSENISLTVTPNEFNENGGVANAYVSFSLQDGKIIEGDLEVRSFANLPRHTNDWPEGAIRKTIIVENDETNEGHRMLYTIRTFIAAGFFVYDIPELADRRWNTLTIDWMNADWWPDYPSLKSQYPDAPWNTAKSFKVIQRGIIDGKYPMKNTPVRVNGTTYIHQVTLDDISVFNWTTKEWENLHDSTRWRLDVYDDPENEKWGFTLVFLQKGFYSYDMRLYWNKVPDNQTRNAALKRNAVIDVSAIIVGEVNKPAINMSVNTGRHLRIRKLFPYEQKESFIIGRSKDGDPLGYEMDFKLAPYMHFANEIHLEDIKIFNKTAGRFENILDRKLFEVRFKDKKAKSRGFETQTKIIQHLIGRAGEGFVDGPVWGYNAEFGVSVFGTVTTAFNSNGHLITFTPMHCPKMPNEDVSLEFNVFQNSMQTEMQMAVIMMEFKTERIEMHGDGYIHNVSSPMAPVSKEFKVIAQYNLDTPYEYEITISKTPQKWVFIEPEWMMTPTFHIPNYNIQQNRLYIMTDKGRFPLINPSTGKPSINSKEVGDGTKVTFLNLYRRYEHLEVRSTPYPMRSVYTQRRVPSHGFIDIAGRINKPLNKKYFEFWMNGRLLQDEVTIITPTKLFLHGLKSLRNFEIIELNRDPNEFFSDDFLEIKQDKMGRPYQTWNYQTYLDAALEGALEDDNYNKEEQEYLLSPVWKQVDQTHPEFKNYPPNVDIEDDIILRINPDDVPSTGMDESSYQYLMIDTPTLEGIAITGRAMSFEQFGWIPITDTMIIELLNEEWSQEIEENPYFPDHVVINDEEWYGTTARLYDEYGILVHNLNDAAYKVADQNLLRINVDNKLSRIVKTPISYDLT